MRKRSIAFCVLLALSAMTGYAAYVYSQYADSQRIPRFFQKARQKLDPLAGGYESLINGWKKDSIPMIRPLTSNQWYAVVLEHSCCTGAGFDAVMIKDSEGHFYISRNNYCGYEGFRLADKKVVDLKSLREVLKKDGFTQP